MKTVPTGSGVTESRDVDSHASATPQVGPRDHITPLQLHTVAPDPTLETF